MARTIFHSFAALTREILFLPLEHKIYISGADPGFFLGGGAPLRNDVTDGEVKKFKSEYVYPKKKASSQGGVRTPCTLPLDPPLYLLTTVSRGRRRKQPTIPPYPYPLAKKGLILRLYYPPLYDLRKSRNFPVWILEVSPSMVAQGLLSFL